MKKVWLYLTLFLLAMLSGLAFPQSTKSLSGLLVDPSGNGINGYLHLSLPANGTVKNTCVTPWQVVPKFDTTFTIASGVIVGGDATNLISTDCLYPRLIYNVEVDDSKSTYIYNDNWYIPNNTDASIDVGTLQQENFGGPITVAVPKGIIANPTANQVITQPTGTSLNLVGTILINGVTFATAAGGVTYTGLVQTNPTTSQTVTQPGATFLNLVGDIRINGNTIASTSSTVGTFNGRTGTVVPLTGDYTCAMITGCVTAGTSYNTIQSIGTNLTRRSTLNFNGAFVAVDNPGSSRTDIGLANIGVTAGTYANPSSVTVNAAGQVTAITGTGVSGTYVLYSWSFTGCSTSVGQPTRCVSSFPLPINMPDASYQLQCMTNSNNQASTSINLQTLGAALPTTSGTPISYSLVQTMQNGTGGSTPTVMCTIHHN